MNLINNPDLFGCKTCAHFIPDSHGPKGYCQRLGEVMRAGDSCGSWEATAEEKADIEFWSLPIAPENKRHGNSGAPQ